ncbi:hypothetical protein AGOR_G00019360 [Albula goreensis]|uniref:Uncharacterized protein n=1 Tax=Albula goreensis TaxID=1534307 RepID=A0A8T3E457_9TELE|nr:hypothetical protein AGOR_G00019360 [Albula goreensis]
MLHERSRPPVQVACTVSSLSLPALGKFNLLPSPAFLLHPINTFPTNPRPVCPTSQPKDNQTHLSHWMKP